jgi:hypothetical protein
MGTYADLGTTIAALAAAKMADEYNAPDYIGMEPDYTSADFAKYFADIPGLLAPYDEAPVPSGFSGMLGSATDLVHTLSRGELPDPPYNEGLPDYSNKELDDFKTVQGFIDNWDGAAAESFNEQFLIHAETYVKNQYLMAAMVHNAIACEQEIWSNTLKSLDDIGEKTTSALESFSPGGGGSLDFTLGVVGTVIGVATGGPVGVAVLFAAAFDIFSSAATSEFADTASIFQIVDGLRDGVAQLKADTTSEEEKLVQLIQANTSYLTEHRDDFVAARGAWDIQDIQPGQAGSPGGLGNPR